MTSRVVKFGLIGLIIFLMYTAISGGYENKDQIVPEQVTETAGPQNDPPAVRQNKLKIDTAVRSFVKAYHLRDEQLFAGGTANADGRFEERLYPFVTATFMDAYVTTLDIPQNQVFIGGSMEQRAHVEKLSYHGHIEEDEADRSASIVVTLFREGEPLERRRMDIEFLLEKQDDSWRVSGCTCDT